MGNRFASGKYAIAQCDRCDQRFKLKMLKREIIKVQTVTDFEGGREFKLGGPGKVEELLD